MLLLLMRHGIAQPLSRDCPDDFHRALTREGRARTKRAARGLKPLVSQLDFLASSPKSRARATAQIVSDAFGQRAPQVTEWPELMDDDLAAVIAKIRALKVETVLLCGHEPHLSGLASLLLSGSLSAASIEFEKAGVMALQADFAANRATLLWHLTPAQLRRIAR